MARRFAGETGGDSRRARPQNAAGSGWEEGFLPGGDRPGQFPGGSSCGDGLTRQAGCPGTTCRSIQNVWLAVMFTEHDRECPSPRCCRDHHIGKTLKCCAVGVDDSAAFGASGGNMRSIPTLPRRSPKDEDGLGVFASRTRGCSAQSGRAVCWRHIPWSRLWQRSAPGTAGEVSGIFGEVMAAVMVRVSSEADSRTGAETAHGRSSGSASEAAFGETASRLTSARGLIKGGGRVESGKRRHFATADRMSGLQCP